MHQLPRADHDQLAPGATIGDWRVVEPIGQGGMSAVFAVTHTGRGHAAALKLMSTEAAARPHAAERFALEARVLQEIGHPGVPQIFDLGRGDDGRPYLVMELLQGHSLHDAIATQRTPTPVGLHIVEQLVDVLMTAHRRGFVHRDLKPDNIVLLDGPGEPVVKLVDWGIAKDIDAAPAATALTSTGAIVGTPRYLAPEQARALPVDARTDVYSLGLVAYELLLGVHPFEASSVAESLMMHMVQVPPSPRRFWPDIPAELERILLAMLAKDPARRPSLVTVLSVIRTVRSQRAAPAPPAVRMRSGELDHTPTMVDAPTAERATSRWRPLRR